MCAEMAQSCPSLHLSVLSWGCSIHGPCRREDPFGLIKMCSRKVSAVSVVARLFPEAVRHLTGTPNSHAAEELQVGIRPAAIRDYWAIAEVHAQSFYPSANWLFAQLLRLDRVFALQVMHSSRHSHSGGGCQAVCMSVCRPGHLKHIVPG